MIHIYGRFIAEEKSLYHALSIIYGIGLVSSSNLCAQLGLSPWMLVKDLTEQDISKLIYLLGKEYRIEGDLKKLQKGDIGRLIRIHSYRGARHKMSLPVRGQRTHTNAQTQKRRGL